MQKLASPLRLSKLFIVMQMVMAVISIAIVCYLTEALLIKILLICGIVVYSYFILKNQLKWEAISHDTSGWSLRSAGENIPIEITGDSTVTHLVSVLRFKTQEKRRKEACIIFRDSLPENIYRQLIVQLRNMR